MQYLRRLPESVPAGKVLVHNSVRTTGRLSFGLRGSRSWLQPPDPERLELCDCTWASELGPHYRVRREHVNDQDP